MCIEGLFAEEVPDSRSGSLWEEDAACGAEGITDRGECAGLGEAVVPKMAV